MATDLTTEFPHVAPLPALFAPHPAASRRFVEFFTANILTYLGAFMASVKRLAPWECFR